jgi:hypothetical protein
MPTMSRPRGTIKNDLTGKTFGSWTVIALDMRPQIGRRRSYWTVECGCGNGGSVLADSLISGRSTKCVECYKKERVSSLTTHGGSGSPTYLSWHAMLSRCESPSGLKDKNYGGRGISVCEEWHSFEIFLRDVGPRPSLKHSIDRIDTNGNYEPGNVRWATASVQATNRRPRGRSS